MRYSHQYRMSLKNKFQNLLISASKKAMAEDDYSDDKYVRAMLPIVNAERAKNGHDEIDLPALARVERLAVGHSDYGSKFSLYCAELSLGEHPLKVQP